MQDGSVIVTDKWGVYNRLEDNGCVYFIVNHSENYIDPETGYHTQGIEKAWVDAKAYTKRALGYTYLLQYHLDELSWRKSVSNREQDIMTDFGMPSASFMIRNIVLMKRCLFQFVTCILIIRCIDSVWPPPVTLPKSPLYQSFQHLQEIIDRNSMEFAGYQQEYDE